MLRFFFFGALTLLPLSAHAQTTSIPQIQGSTDKSPLLAQNVTVEGVVTGDFQNKEQFSGFFVQDAVGDSDAATSDGVFVYVNARSPAAGVDVKVGDRVRVAGVVEEYRGQTQIGRTSKIEVLGQAIAPAPAKVSLPLPDASAMERFEGMLVTFPDSLVVTAQNDLQNFGALTLSPLSRLFVPTNEKPLAEGGAKDDQTIRSLVLDDGSGARNPKPAPYLDPSGTRRTGSKVQGLTGVLSFDYGEYRLQPTIAPVFEDNPRPASPPEVGSDFKVAAANVLNYWTTFKNAANPNARGAKGAAEFGRQSAKIVTELRGLDADVVGLMELENNGPKAIGDLVSKLNAAYGAPVYAAIEDPATGTGPDAIKVGIIYKTASATPRGPAICDTSKIFDRFPLAQTFVAKNGGVFTVVVNHFKSKGSGPDAGDTDQGEGAWNQKRVEQAGKLATFIQSLKTTSGDPDVLAIGDFNAYVEESPMLALRKSGLKHLNLRLAPEERYSFSFDGRFGSLDHALATPELDGQVTGFGEWHINSDEPFFLSYDRSPATGFKANPFRASDHDPLLIGLKLTP